MKGVFITIEGPEGSGKTYHSKLLCDFLRVKGYNILHTREPGGTVISEEIRKILLDKKNDKMSRECELLLFLAARAQIVNEVIIPSLKKGYIVICDRFEDATVAYQGYGAGFDIKFVEEISKFVTGGLKPNLTVLLDIDVKDGLLRAARRRHPWRAGIKDRMEVKSLSFHKCVRKGYLELAKKHPRRIKVVSTDRDKEEVQDAIRNIVLKFLR